MENSMDSLLAGAPSEAVSAWERSNARLLGDRTLSQVSQEYRDLARLEESAHRHLRSAAWATLVCFALLATVAVRMYKTTGFGLGAKAALMLVIVLMLGALATNICRLWKRLDGIKLVIEYDEHAMRLFRKSIEGS